MIWLKGIFLGYSFFTPRIWRLKLQCKKSPTKIVSVDTRRKEGNVLFNGCTQHIFIYGYMASGIW